MRITVFGAAGRTRLPPGVHHLHQVLTLADLPLGRGIHLDEGCPGDGAR
jgi:hypothetical protein